MRKWKDVIQKESYGQESRPSWLSRIPTQQSLALISQANVKQQKVMSTFDFSTLYTKIPQDKLLYALNETTDLAFKGGTRDYVTVYNSGAFWSRSKSQTKRSYSLQEIKSCLEFLIINSSFFQAGSKIFRQVIGTPSSQIMRNSLLIIFCSSMNLDG